MNLLLIVLYGLSSGTVSITIVAPAVCVIQYFPGFGPIGTQNCEPEKLTIEYVATE